MKLNKWQVAFGLGIFLGGIHLLWALAIAIMPVFMQNLLNWILGLHFLKPYLILEPASFTKGLFLVLMTFVCGFLMGLLFTFIYNLFVKKQKTLAAKKPVAKKRRR